MENVTIMLIIGVVLGIILAVVPTIIWKIKTKCSIWPFFAGAIIFVLFAKVFESLAYALMLNASSPLYTIITGNIVIYGIVGGLMAGLFEETGRLFAYKVFLKKSTSIKDSVTYGLGHGACELILVLVLTYAIYIPFSLGITTGIEATDQTITQALQSFTWALLFAALFERISALILHIGLSILMYIAAKKNKMWLFPVSILLHAIVDFIAVIVYQFTGHIALTEIIIFVLSVLVLLFAFFMQYKVMAKKAEKTCE